MRSSASGNKLLMAILLYGAGLRLLECCRLRVKDVDFATNQILIRDGKGRKDRATMLPVVVKPGPRWRTSTRRLRLTDKERPAIHHW